MAWSLDGKDRIGVLAEDKNAVIYGADGSIGGVVAREGAKVDLAGRTLVTLDEVAEEIRSCDQRKKRGL